MNILLGILLVGLFFCALVLGAARSPKAKGIVNEKSFNRVAIYTAVIIALIVIVGIIKFNTD